MPGGTHIDSDTLPSFEAVIEEARQGGAWVRIPPSIMKAFGGRRRVRVRATFDAVAYRGSIATMAGGAILGIRKDIRRALGKGIGDSVRVTLQEDLEPRTLAIPEDLALEFAKRPQARSFFDGLSFTHRKELVEGLTGAKKEETRRRRLQKTLAQLEQRLRS